MTWLMINEILQWCFLVSVAIVTLMPECKVVKLSSVAAEVGKLQKTVYGPNGPGR